MADRLALLLLIMVEIKRHYILRQFTVLISHTEHGSPSLDALKLILKDVAPAVAPDDENYIQVTHLIEVLAAVSPDFAYDLLELVAGGGTFFPSSGVGASSVSVAGTTSGMVYH